MGTPNLEMSYEDTTLEVALCWFRSIGYFPSAIVQGVAVPGCPADSPMLAPIGNDLPLGAREAKSFDVEHKGREDEA